MPALRYRVLPGDFAVCRLSPDEAEPSWVRGAGFCNVTRTAEELSIICAAERVPAEIRAERGWRVMQVVGPLPFDAVGILARFVSPLAKVGIPILAAATFDTDYVLVRQDALMLAEQALAQAGHEHVE
ncbi:ACT domain-containing protein [Synoicihabitans lomoniglobus]|uniref:ACT domain-containing protein n=1 Tax=Synoicihabitans lomoniglobus TaxID=2909285 RepID=A0AAF0CR32_9BACT|nr:ACT domain-containing protein [Opitutaceae bacterium LMO-M01]WED66502.1 ACT domain-containing protein [Opitutaceae bacterium LMO-M01]